MSAESIKTPAFDPQLLTQLLADRKTPGQIEDLLKDLRKAFIEHALEGELTDLLGYPKHHPDGRKSGNSRNGFSRKTVKTDESEIEVNIPRDRNAEFDPKLLAKHQKRWDGFDVTILALYARGMSLKAVCHKCRRHSGALCARDEHFDSSQFSSLQRQQPSVTIFISAQ